jgi:hypothetical protein
VNPATPKAGAKHELLFNKLEVGLLNISLTLVAQQSAAKIIPLTNVNLVTPKAGAKYELFLQ